MVSSKTFSDLSEGTGLKNNNNKRRYDNVIYNNIMEEQFSVLNHMLCCFIRSSLTNEPLNLKCRYFKYTLQNNSNIIQIILLITKKPKWSYNVLSFLS